MSDPYGLPEEDLRRLLSSRNNLNTNIQEPLCLYGVNGAAASSFPPPNSCYDPNPIMAGDVFFPRGFTHYDYSSSVVNNPTTYSTATTVAAATTATFCGIETAEKGSWLGFDSAGNNRWPRQETLSLLEIRSRLDSKFRENNQKAPLWNEISRIMAEEFGYQRSGKKCKEKFENLYKYYKKTKEGKASRQDGKHYRFFRQLEAICGDQASTQHTSSSSDHKNKTHHAATNTVGTQTQAPGFTINQDDNIGDHHFNNLKSSESLSFSNNSSEFETSSSENNDEDLSAIAHMMNKQKGLVDLDQRQSHDRRVRKSWRAKVEEIVDSHMRKIIETQDAWMERMLSVVEQRENKEEERMKRKESMRFDQEVHELWAKEKAWVEARDAAMIEVVRKHIGNQIELEALLPPNYKNLHCEGHVDHGSSSRWTEMEISNLIQLRTGFDQQRVRESVYMDNDQNGVWDEIAEKMVYMGFDRNASECKRIWDEISISLRRTVECGEVKARPWCLGLKLTDDG